MLKFYIFLYFSINFVYGSDRACVGKHILPINDENYTILKRHIGVIHTTGFANQPNEAILENNGQTVLIKYFYDKLIPTIVDGPYKDEQYQLEFMYFNWLKENLTKEAVLPIELHLVFFNQKYESYEKAVKRNFGVTVWSFKYVQSNSSADEITNEFYDSIHYVQTPYTIELFHPGTFLTPLYMLTEAEPEYYYVYQGRLTATLQSCSADVIWLEFRNTLKLNAQQVVDFSRLLDKDGKPLMSKFYETTAPNGPIFKNIDEFDDEFEYLSVLGFEYFNATSNGEGDTNLSAKHYGNIGVLLVLSFYLLLRML